LENGFVDFITDRRALKKNLGTLLKQLLEERYGSKKRQNGKSKANGKSNGSAGMANHSSMNGNGQASNGQH
jgi:hypothetical protein